VSSVKSGDKLRKDAQRNRVRLLAAAREVFAEQGLDASLEEVARRAEVGIGTLYRHFPTRDALVEALLDNRMKDVTDAGTRALEAVDGWSGFRLFLESVLELQSADRNLFTVFAHYGSGSGRLQDMRRQTVLLAQPVIDRAKREGTLRADFDISDLIAVFWAQGRIIEATQCIAPRWWRRQLALMLDGFRAEGASPLPEAPLTASQLRRARATLLDKSRARAGSARNQGRTRKP
jgi:AcrR family transcriptional regulator